VTAVGKNLACCSMGLSHSRGATALPMRAGEVVPTASRLSGEQDWTESSSTSSLSRPPFTFCPWLASSC
jgi:hypothetical protein